MLPKKTKANGFWSFATSVRAQLQLYNPSETAAYVAHSQELWELMSKDEQQEWNVFAREMDVRERLCPEFVVDIAADVQKQYDEDQKKRGLSSVGGVKEEPEVAKEEKEAPAALTVKGEEHLSTVQTDEISHEENWHTASESTEGVSPKQSPEAETRLHVQETLQETPNTPKEPTLPPASNVFTRKPHATVKETTSTGLDGLFGEGGLNEYIRSPTRITLMESAPKWSQQKKLDSVPTTNASAPLETALPTAVQRDKVVQEVTESLVPARAVQDDSVRSDAQQPQPSPVLTTDWKNLLEPERPRFESSIGVDLSPDSGNAERVLHAETSPTTACRSSSMSTLAKKRPTTLPPSLLIKKEAAAKAATMQKQQLEPQVVSPVLEQKPAPAKVQKVMSISKSMSTLRTSVSRTSEPSTPGSPTVSSENRSFGFGRGVSLRK